MPADPQPNETVEVFFSYSHKDEELRDQLASHLAMLQREGVIESWHDRQILAGAEWDGQIDEHLNSADVILLLVSADFLKSKYCYDIEVKRAMERHEAGAACVIPVIVRACDWNGAPFGKLQALPKNARPVRKWRDRDEAFLDIAQGIRKAVKEFKPRAPSSRSIHLPRASAISFVARRDAQGRDIVERLQDELAPGKNRPVTLSGPGGVGKTRLAAEAAREMQEIFKGRVVWSSAAGRADFTLSTLLDDIAAQLDHAELRTRAPEAKEEQLRALVAEPLALVVLDNYETVAPDVQQRIEKWFARAQCSALITSRHKIAATVNIPIAAMSPEEAQEFLEKVVEQTQDPQIFTSEIRQRIYETAEANPFLMEWIVAQIDEAREPRTVLEELAHGEGDAAERVFNRSLNLLRIGDDGRAALFALSLFAPSASRPALAEVAGFGDDQERLKEAVKNLRALWLIKGLHENRHFTVEGLTHSLTKARFSKDKRAGEFRQRFVAYFLRYAEAHTEPTSEDLAALEAEKDNVLNAMDAAFAMQYWDSVMQIRLALEEFLYLRGYWDDAIQRGEQAVAAAREAKDEWAIAQFSGNVAKIRISRGEYEKARQAYQQVLVAFRKLGSHENVAAALHQIGIIAQRQCDWAEARRFYSESLEIKRRLRDQSGIARTLYQLGMIAQSQGDLAEARRLYGKSLEISKSLGDQNGIANITSRLGVIHYELGEFDESKAKHEESIAIKRKLEEQRGIATDLHQLGNIACMQGDLAGARRFYGESLEISRRLGDQRCIAVTLHQMGVIAQRQGDLAEAQRLYDESLVIAKGLGDQHGVANTLGQLGLLAEEKVNKAEAARLFREALIIFEKLGSPNANLARQSLERVEGESA
ncbi:MAG: tetratricopeptide repeat protein [Pyrinomonadaceae bacterium]